MAKRRSRRSTRRKEQSRRDKTNRLFDRTTSEPFREYCQFLETVRSHGMAAGEYTKIPLELIDLTATLIATLIAGHSYSYFLLGPTVATTNNSASDDFHAALHHDVAFIRRVLRRAQISCTELILSLFYIDRFFHVKGKHGARRRRRLDGAENRIDSGSEGDAGSGGESSGSGSMNERSRTEVWSTRDLFMASILVADKFLADATWPNKEWSLSTSSLYSPSHLTRLEFRFLTTLDYRLFVTEQQYRDFVAYIEVSLHLNEVLRRGLTLASPLSYKDLRVLTQRLIPDYVRRLRWGATTRPIQVMVLVAAYAAAILMCYVATVVVVAVGGLIVRLCWEQVVRNQVEMAWRAWVWWCSKGRGIGAPGAWVEGLGMGVEGVGGAEGLVVGCRNIVSTVSTVGCRSVVSGVSTAGLAMVACT